MLKRNQFGRSLELEVDLQKPVLLFLPFFTLRAHRRRMVWWDRLSTTRQVEVGVLE